MSGSFLRRSIFVLAVFAAFILSVSAAMHDRKSKSRKLSVTGNGDAKKIDNLVKNLPKLPRKAQGGEDWDYDDSSSSGYDQGEDEKGGKEESTVDEDAKTVEEKKDYEEKKGEDEEEFPADPWAESTNGMDPIAPSSNTTVVTITNETLNATIGSAASNTSLINPLNGSINATMFGTDAVEQQDFEGELFKDEEKELDNSAENMGGSELPNVSSNVSAVNDTGPVDKIIGSATSNSSLSDPVIVIENPTAPIQSEIEDVSNSTTDLPLAPADGNSTTDDVIIPGANSDTDAGNTTTDGEIPVDCVVSEWTLVKACPLACGTVGELEEVREILTPAKNGGEECPKLEQVKIQTLVLPSDFIIKS